MRRRVVTLALFLLAPQLAAAQPAETIEYYAQDAIGSIRVVFNPAGTVLARQDYAPFGRPLFTVPAMPREGFGGQEKDDETDQAYFHARMFQARTGRFTQPDPMFAGLFVSSNQYGYARGNPLMFVDPWGTSECQVGSYYCPPSTQKPEQYRHYEYVQVTAPLETFSLATAIGLALGQPSQPSPVSIDWAGILASRTAAGGVVAAAAEVVSTGSSVTERAGGATEVVMAAVPGGKLLPPKSVQKEVAAAALKYAKKAGKFEWHHVDPKYLGGDPKGEIRLLSAPYHQLITNYFRDLWRYGQGPAEAAQRAELLRQVYQRYPLPPPGGRW